MVNLKNISIVRKASGQILWAIILAVFLISITSFIGHLLVKENKVMFEKKEELARLQRDLELLDQILVDQKNNQEKIQAVSQTLPVSFEEVTFSVVQIERIASKNELELETKIDASAKPESNQLLSLGMSLETKGYYQSFSEMLSNLANLPYHTRIDSLKIQEAGGEINTLTNFQLYLKKEEKK